MNDRELAPFLHRSRAVVTKATFGDSSDNESRFEASPAALRTRGA